MALRHAVAATLSWARVVARARELLRGEPPAAGRHLLRVTASDHQTGSAFVEFDIEVE